MNSENPVNNFISMLVLLYKQEKSSKLFYICQRYYMNKENPGNNVIPILALLYEQGKCSK